MSTHDERDVVAVMRTLIWMMKMNGELDGLSEEEQLRAVKAKSAIPEEWARARREYEGDQAGYKRRWGRR